MEQNPAKMKEFVSSKLGKVSHHVENVFRKTALDCMLAVEVKVAMENYIRSYLQGVYLCSRRCSPPNDT